MAGDYACPTCDKTFTRTTHVVRHQRIHTNTRPYPCKSCHERFTRSDLVTRHRIKFHPSEELRPQAGIDSAVLPKNKKGRMTLSSPEHEREDVSGLRGGPNKDMMTCSLSDLADGARSGPIVDGSPASFTRPRAGTFGADADGRSARPLTPSYMGSASSVGPLEAVPSGSLPPPGRYPPRSRTSSSPDDEGYLSPPEADGDGTEDAYMDAYYQTLFPVTMSHQPQPYQHPQQYTYPTATSDVAAPPPSDPTAGAWSSAGSGSGSGSSLRSFQAITPAQPYQMVLPVVCSEEVDSPAAYVPHLIGQTGIFDGWDASGMDVDGPPPAKLMMGFATDGTGTYKARSFEPHRQQLSGAISRQRSSDWIDSNNMFQQSGQSHTETDWTYETDPQPPPPPPMTAAPSSLLLPHYNVDAGLVAYNRQQIPVDPYQQLARHLMATAERANPAAPAPPPFPYPEPHGTQAGETDAFADALRRRNGSGGGAFELRLGRRG